MKVYIDYREKKSGVLNELIKHGINVEIKSLPIADYIITGNNQEGKFQEIGIERKTQTDFINSIIDKRIINQLIVLKENFEFPLLIIEGSDNLYELRDFHPNAIRGMLTSIALDYQVPIIHTKNYRDTAAHINVIVKRLEKSKRALSLLSKRKPLTLKEQQEYIIESLPGIGPTLAKLLLNKFGNVKAIVNASEDELQEVDKIGKKKASEIKKVLTNIYEESR